LLGVAITARTQGSSYGMGAVIIGDSAPAI
jgi:hypothetical protein